MNLSKGKIGEDNSALLGAMMITKIQLAAMTRVDMPEHQRKDFYLYVDEFQNFATDSFIDILSEARKYRLNLVLAHQYISQLEERVQHAVLGNVGTILAFRLGAMDAETLEKEFEPTFHANDLVNLTKHNIYLKLMIDGVAADPFSGTALPPIELESTEKNLERVIRSSREKHATPRKKVEREIMKWSGVSDSKIKSKIAELVEKQKSIEDRMNEAEKTEGLMKDLEEKKPKIEKPESENNGGEDRQFNTKCSGCNDYIQVPFEPDGVRPTFCTDCLKSYRSQQSKLEQENDKEPKKSLNRDTQKCSIKNKKTKNKVDKSGVRDLLAKAMKIKKQGEA